MKLSSVIGRAWRVYRTHFKALMLALLVELALRGIALAPLLFLVMPQTRLLALLCIPLYLLIVLPARQNVALAVQETLAGGSPFSLLLISGEDYRRKLLRGLTAMLRMFLWCLPLIAAVSVALWAKSGPVDAFTVYRSIIALGGGNSVRGAAIVGGVFLLTLLPPLFGCAFHSGTRHAVAMGKPRLVKKHRGPLMCLWFLFFLPFIALVVVAATGYVQALLAAVNEFLATFEFVMPAVGTTLAAELVILLLVLPIIPLRTLLPAVYLQGLQEADPDAAP